MCNNKFSVVATGDSLISMQQSIHREKDFLAMVKLIKSANVSFTNLEMTLHDYEGYPSARLAGIYLCAHPSMIEELKWMGFNLFSFANNHANDFSEGGLIATIKNLKRAGVIYAGAGMNLEEARAPAFLETERGRVALIAAASESFGRAGPSRKDMQGRPGLNPLRFDVQYSVGKDIIEDLRKISDQLGFLKVYNPQDEYYFLGNRFVKKDQVGIHTTPNKMDAIENLKSIKEAKQQADLVLFSLHTHRGKSARNEQVPAEFMEAFARKCIDEGAHAVIGHGYHALRGIEVYNGRPIFYSLGNFIYQSETIRKHPAEYYEYVGLDPYRGKPQDISNIRKEMPFKPGSRPNEWSYEKEARWESVIAYMVFKGNRLSELKLYPISLGFDLPRSQRGRPMMADRELSEKILEKVQELSYPYGTEIEIIKGVGVIKVMNKHLYRD